MTQSGTLRVPANAENMPVAASFKFQPTNLADAMRYATMIASSSIVPEAYKEKAGDILIAMQMGAEVGLPPMQALQSICVIKGRPTIWGDGALAIIRKSPLCKLIRERIATHAEVQSYLDALEKAGENEVLIAAAHRAFWRLTPSPKALTDEHLAVCEAQRDGSEPVFRTFSVSDAKVAGLWNKDGPWRTYPQRMLQMRARSWAIRDGFPDVMRGLQVVEEVYDIPEPVNVTPPAAAPPEAGSAATADSVVQSRADQIRERLELDRQNRAGQASRENVVAQEIVNHHAETQADVEAQTLFDAQTAEPEYPPHVTEIIAAAQDRGLTAQTLEPIVLNATGQAKISDPKHFDAIMLALEEIPVV